MSEASVVNLYQRQLELEEHMSVAGLERLKSRSLRERDGKRGHHTPAGKMLMDAILAPATQSLTEWMGTARTRPGVNHKSLVYLEQIKPELAVFIAARLAVDAVMTQDRLVTLCERIGSQVEDQVKYDHFVNNGKLIDGGDVKPYWDEIHRRLSSINAKSYESISGYLDKAMDLHEFQWSAWGERARMRVGEKLLDVIATSTELIQIITQQCGRKKKVVVYPGPGICELIDDYEERLGLLQPVFLPCVIKPKAWTRPYGGGYHGRRIRRLTLVKTRNKAYLDDLAGVEMPKVYEAINRLQDTPWSVNPHVLEVVQDLKVRGYGTAGLPVREDLPLPEFPDQDREDFEDAKAAWKAEARQIHEFNALNLSRRMATERIVMVAEDFSEYDEFFYPYQLDFRGRVYPVASDLQPQGCDLSRGLLQFAKAKPINHPEQARWLAVHGANCFGVDKVAMEARVDWVGENEDRILSVASDPLEDRWWEEADKPFQFLAWCIDWAGFLADGYGYESSLPIQMDGTCNGLQIFSLLLRDEVGGDGVNLVPREEPQDIYQRVADKTLDKLREILRTSPASEEGEWAERWVACGVDRKLCKRPVMTLPYGVTKFSMRSFVHDMVKERHGGDTRETLFGDDKQTRKACNWMGDLIWSSIGEVVIAARGAMDWLQALARQVNEHGRPILWWTPAGLPVRQHYTKHRTKRLQLHIGEKWINPHISEETSRLDTARQANGIAPNYVHSLDGAAMALTVCKAAAYGVESFSMVHDSYGTHAADSQVLAESLREVFVEMFLGKDLLGQLEDEARASVPGDDLEIPERPEMGNLDVELLLESEYFFA